MNPTLYYIDVRNRGGSVEHYYHFLLGYLLPLCDYVAQRRDKSSIMLARACGPLNKIVTELNIPGLVLCERKSHTRLAGRAGDLGLETVEIRGADFGSSVNWYEPDRLTELVDRGGRYIRGRLRSRIEAYRAQLETEWHTSPRLLVIEREEPDPYYLSAFAEIQGAGASRRAITNNMEMVTALTRAFGRPKIASLEPLGLAEQIALFQTADIVVAQHGAALSNIIWMRKAACVFEFVQEPDGQRHFSGLSAILGINHFRLHQEQAIGPVNLEELIEAITTRSSGFSAK